MSDWQAGWRTLEPSLPTQGLIALADALRTGSPELFRGDTVRGPNQDEIHPDSAPCSACAIAYALWKGRQLVQVRQVQHAWKELMDEHRRGAAGDGIEAFIRWFDGRLESDADVFAQLLTEVEAAIMKRAKQHERRVGASQL